MIVRRAIIRLAIRFSLVLLGIVALFAVGVALYTSVAFDLELPDVTEEAVGQANMTLRTALIACFAALFLIIPPISYVLAKRTLAPVRANLEAQQRFVDDASHEFRTPIAIAQGELELALLHPRTPEEYQTATRAALDALDELGMLTADLLLLASEEGIGQAADVIDMAELGERVLLSVPAELRVRVELSIRGSGQIRGSMQLLVRAIANLLENAHKFSPPDSSITLQLERVKGVVRVSVTDSGPGMSPAQLARAFDRFWRADAARSTDGRGVGLSIVQRIAQLHDGQAILLSTPGCGMTASLEIPCIVES